MDTIADALSNGKAGVDPWADAMLKEAQERRTRRQNAGRRGGLKKAENQKAKERQAAQPAPAPINPPDRRPEVAGSPKPRPATPAPTTETPAEEARRLGFAAYAGIAAELRALVPAGIPLAAVYRTAEAKAFKPEELLRFANHHAMNGWRTSRGGGVSIGTNNIGNVLAKWASYRKDFERADTGEGNGSNTNRIDGRGRGPRIAATEYRDDPFS